VAHILLVEDELWLGELYERLFGKDHHVAWARDGYEAIDLIEAATPDVIVLDIMLPWSNGIQLLHELASYDDTHKIPVVLFSAALPNDIDDDILRAYGVVATLDKTTTKPQQVIKTINGVLRAHADISN
jgi:CheY-like chemotaxis protein